MPLAACRKRGLAEGNVQAGRIGSVDKDKVASDLSHLTCGKCVSAKRATKGANSDRKSDTGFHGSDTNLDCTARKMTSLATSRRRSPRRAELLVTPIDASLPSGRETMLLFLMPARCNKDRATCRPFPGNFAAASSHGQGIGPRKNNSPLRCRGSPPGHWDDDIHRPSSLA
jgi:hypothetical protein